MGAVTQEAWALAGSPDRFAEQMCRALLNHPGEITAGHSGQGGVGKAALDIFNIAGVEPGRLDPDQDLVGARDGCRQVNEAEVVRCRWRKTVGLSSCNTPRRNVHRG